MGEASCPIPSEGKPWVLVPLPERLFLESTNRFKATISRRTMTPYKNRSGNELIMKNILFFPPPLHLILNLFHLYRGIRCQHVGV